MRAASLTSPGFTSGHALYFRSLFSTGRGFSFPCDEHGMVETEALSAALRSHYSRARQMVGRDLAAPVVVPTLIERH